MRLTTRTNLAMRTLMYCAVNTGRNIRTSEIAEATNASKTISVRSSILWAKPVSSRPCADAGWHPSGPRTGRHHVGGVFRVFEACVPFAECFSPDACNCPLVSACR